MNQDSNKTQEISYNAAVKEIEDIIREMQSENCDIDRLADNTRRAAQLIELCRNKLTRTEDEIQKILTALEKK